MHTHMHTQTHTHIHTHTRTPPPPPKKKKKKSYIQPLIGAVIIFFRISSINATMIVKIVTKSFHRKLRLMMILHHTQFFSCKQFLEFRTYQLDRLPHGHGDSSDSVCCGRWQKQRTNTAASFLALTGISTFHISQRLKGEDEAYDRRNTGNTASCHAHFRSC